MGNALKFAIFLERFLFAFLFMLLYFKFTKTTCRKDDYFLKKNKCYVLISADVLFSYFLIAIIRFHCLIVPIHRYSHLSYQWKIVTEQCIFSRIYQTTFTKTNSGTKWVNNCQSNSKGRNRRRRRWWFGWRFVLMNKHIGYDSLKKYWPKNSSNGS